MKKLTLVSFIIATLFSITSCSKDDDNPTTPSTNNNSNASGQPIPNISGTVGVLATISFDYQVPGFPIAANYIMGFAQYGTPNGKDIGTVKVNNNSLIKTTTGSNTYYTSFTITNPASLSNVSFNGSTHNWDVSGGNGLIAFTASVTSPSNFNLTSPTANASVSKSSGLKISWTGTSSSDSVIIVLTPTSNPNNLIIKTGVANSGSYTFTSAELSAVSGQTMVQLVKYRYAIKDVSGQKIAVVAEIVKNVTITLN